MKKEKRADYDADEAETTEKVVSVFWDPLFL